MQAADNDGGSPSQGEHVVGRGIKGCSVIGRAAPPTGTAEHLCRVRRCAWTGREAASQRASRNNGAAPKLAQSRALRRSRRLAYSTGRVGADSVLRRGCKPTETTERETHDCGSRSLTSMATTKYFGGDSTFESALNGEQKGFFFLFFFPLRRGRIMASSQRRPPRAHAPVAAAILRTWQRGGPRENIGKQGQAAAATTSWVGNSGGSVRRRPGTIPPLAPAGRTAHRDGQRTEIVKRCHGQISRPLQYRKAMRCSASAEYLPRSAPSVTSDLPTLRESSKSDARIACNHDQRPWLA